ncbi:NADP-dependent oxidoreductase [Glaciihabitans sp. dw_435]|uniref:NADP-dependent oxidoreductase n=1 Tax=Glaciihabitans sp. dw_435 TaxID=2720081 RepID=UPI0035AB761E
MIFERFGGPEQLLLRRTVEPRPGPGQARVRVTAIGLNPMDWMISSDAALAAAFGVSIPSGFAHDFAGVVDEIADTSLGFAAGDRVFGSVSSRAAADHLIIGPTDIVYRTPGGIPDDVASTLTVAGLTASAALSVIGVSSSDTVLIGGAAGGVGVFAVQLARLIGATVIGTAASTTAPFLRELGAEPISYGPDLANRISAMAGAHVSAATDLFGTETAHAALTLRVPHNRISAIAARSALPIGVLLTSARDAAPHAMDIITDAILAGQLRVPIAEKFPLDRIQDAVIAQAARHTHGKIVVTT